MDVCSWEGIADLASIVTVWEPDMYRRQGYRMSSQRVWREKGGQALGNRLTVVRGGGAVVKNGGAERMRMR